MNKGYPCVLIVGQRQYLNPLNKRLTKEYENVSFTQASGRLYETLDGYKILRTQDDSNLGWRILAALEFSHDQMAEMIKLTQDGTPIKNLLPFDFVEKHSLVLELIRKQGLEEADNKVLNELLGDQAYAVIDHFYTQEEEEVEHDMTQPSILLSSFEGCKGLSAGHVFIVGLNNGVMPWINSTGEVADIEISKFIVAMTRTRKLLYLLSNLWDYSPRCSKYNRSAFIGMIPPELRFDGGFVKSAEAEAMINSAWDV